ncbi:aminopeptidase [Erysipelothrix sp. HDW6C]|uniref:aminopeptidase n=1 Tax=Erysipelothrix sp. HDW6C TaxID=2714930 RepID=UPI00140A74E8|nr:aminopeptidase [Erysipelothrix sp. HDW6C]QIK70201.1 aminopeptidase [Erysipelothrix sp. HDW6C]
MKAIDRKYAQLLINTGVNVQSGQTLMINADPEHHEFVTLLAEEAYKNGAKEVIVKFNSEHLARLNYLYQDVQTLTRVPQWVIDEHDDYLKTDLCKLALRSPNPGLLNDVDSKKVTATAQARGKALTRFSNYSMSSQGQWLVAAYPSQNWAKAVFPDMESKDAYDKLYEYILYACRVSADNDPEAAWEQHNAQLAKQNLALNNYDFKSLRFTNSKGTDIVVGLVEGHIWSGGKKPSQKGVPFNANIPTEESFTTPDRNFVEGIVYNTLPLNNNGRLIDDFWLKFENGQVVDFDASVGKEALAGLLETDENSRRIGEIALISDDSPISNLNTLFYNTLFDENASCHIALGQGYPLIEDGGKMSKDELLARDINQSLIHVDFMFGSADMQCVGTTKSGEEIVVIKDGNIVL